MNNNYGKFPFRIFNFGKTWSARYYNSIEDAQSGLTDIQYERIEKRIRRKIADGTLCWNYEPV